jgi:hypothetical protein
LTHDGKDLKLNPEEESRVSGLKPPRTSLHSLKSLAKPPNRPNVASLKQYRVGLRCGREEEVCHGSNRDIPVEILGYKLKFLRI